MVEDGILSAPKRRKNEPGIRGGKALSGTPMFAEANVTTVQVRQVLIRSCRSG